MSLILISAHYYLEMGSNSRLILTLHTHTLTDSYQLFAVVYNTLQRKSSLPPWQDKWYKNSDDPLDTAVMPCMFVGPP